MNPFLPRTCAAIATTVVLSAVATAIPQEAHAYLIKRSAGPSIPSGVNPSLAPPTVIDFDDLSGQVPNNAPPIGPGSANDGLNGGATIDLNSGYAEYSDDQLRIGRNGNPQPRDGEVNFQFDDPRGMGYLGFFLQQTPNNPNNALVTFFNNGAQVASFTMDALLNGPVPGSTVVGTGNYFSFFVTNNDEIFDQVLFADTSNGQGQGVLVIDNLAYQAIPTPALLPALVGLGLGLVRKKKAQAEAEA